MAGEQINICGDDGDYHFGPGVLYYNTTAGFIPAGFTGATGTGTEMGKTGPMEVQVGATYAEAKSIQTGTEMDDAAVSGQKCIISTTLMEAGLDRLETSVDGIVVERDTDSQPTQWGYANVIGKRKRASSFRMTLVEQDAGLQQWDVPFRVVDFFETVSMSPDTTININAEAFREIAVQFRAFPSESNLTSLGKQGFFLSRILTTE